MKRNLKYYFKSLLTRIVVGLDYDEDSTILELDNGATVSVTSPPKKASNLPKRDASGRFTSTKRPNKPVVKRQIVNRIVKHVPKGSKIYTFLYKGEKDNIERCRKVLLENQSVTSFSGLDILDNFQYKTFLRNRIVGPIMTNIVK